MIQGFRFGLRTPLLPGGQRHHCLHVGAGGGRDRHVIDMQTIDHRREHRVGGRKIPEEKGASLTELLAGLSKSLFEAGDIGACLGGQLALFDLAAHIHRQQLAHAHEARMHFGGE